MRSIFKISNKDTRILHVRKQLQGCIIDQVAACGISISMQYKTPLFSLFRFNDANTKRLKKKKKSYEKEKVT